MEFLIITLTIFLSLTCGSGEDVDVAYLTGVPRLGNHVHLDYYFSCATEGLTLQWEVNEQSLGGFSPGQVVDTLSSTRSSFSYTATLLSSQPTSGGFHTFNSVLIVSVMDNSTLNVTCLNGLSSNNTQSGDIGTVEISEATNTVVLEFVLELPVLGLDSYSTSIFICGTENRFMSWETDTDIFVLTASDSVGQDQQNLQPNDTFVRQQAILLDNNPNQLVTVFFVTDSADVAVTCGFMTNVLQIFSTRDGTTTDSSIFSSSFPSSSTSRTDFSSTQGTPATTEITESENSTPIIIGVVIVIVFILSSIAIVSGIVIYFCIKPGKKSKSEEPVINKKESKSEEPVINEPQTSPGSGTQQSAPPSVDETRCEPHLQRQTGPRYRYERTLLRQNEYPSSVELCCATTPDRYVQPQVDRVTESHFGYEPQLQRQTGLPYSVEPQCMGTSDRYEPHLQHLTGPHYRGLIKKNTCHIGIQSSSSPWPINIFEVELDDSTQLLPVTEENKPNEDNMNIILEKNYLKLSNTDEHLKIVIYSSTRKPRVKPIYSSYL